MADDLKTRGLRDRSRINVEENYERRYWSKKFGITEQQLRDTVKQVGPVTANVQRRLGK
jgi:hypothetical protein